MCVPSVDSNLSIVGASSSKTQRNPHMSKNGDSSSKTVPPGRLLYHCSFCGNDGHQLSFCYRRAKRMRRAHASKSSSVHSLFHGMKTSETSTRPRFIDGFFDYFSSGFGHARRRASSALPVGL